MSWEEAHRIQQLESKVRKLEDRLDALEGQEVLTVRGRPIPVEEFINQTINRNQK